MYPWIKMAMNLWEKNDIYQIWRVSNYNWKWVLQRRWKILRFAKIIESEVSPILLEPFIILQKLCRQFRNNFLNIPNAKRIKITGNSKLILKSRKIFIYTLKSYCRYNCDGKKTRRVRKSTAKANTMSSYCTLWFQISTSLYTKQTHKIKR